MKAIVAADQNWGIGQGNKLLISIPADMRFFRETTTDHVVVMGRKTLESFPNQKPLKDRINIVLTRDTGYQAKGAIIAHSIEELMAALEPYDQDEVYVIGGEQVYRQLLPHCDTAYVTKIDYVYQADAYFPDLDRDPEWEIASESEEQTYFDIEYTFRTYRRR
ncbi:MAG: dihydrofolate reductase [Eubacterium sp.]|nr:dihydrofolate reductase [Eubacterium sp.]